MINISISAIIVLFIITLVTATAKSEESAEDLENELQWILDIPDKDWRTEIKSLALMLESGNYTGANNHLDSWLMRDFDTAILSLPNFQQFHFYFSGYDYASIFAKYLDKFDGEKRIHMLANLGLKNTSVSQVGFLTMSEWWFKSSQEMSDWIKRTPGFFETLYIEEFLHRVLIDNKNHSSLFQLFFSLQKDDIRKGKFIAQITESWLKYDSISAINHIEKTIANQDKNTDVAFDQSLQLIGYHYSNLDNYEKSLIWALKIRDPITRDLSIREYSFSVEKPTNIHHFSKILKDYKFTKEKFHHEILSHFKNVKIRN